jgi:septal ring-binding cell division protein DamX
MTQAIQQAIQTLQGQLKHHQEQGARITRAINELQGLTDMGAPTTRAVPKAASKPVKRRKVRTKKAAAAKSAPAKTAKPAKKANGKLTLSKALAYVLGEHRKAGSANASAQQLMASIGKAGFKFGGKNQENNMNYLYKTLRKNKQFKRVGDGQYALA